MSRDNPESFAFYESFYEAIAALPTQKMQNELFHAVCEYGLYGKKPKTISKTANAMFIGFAYQIDSAKANRKSKRSAGSKGGSASKTVSKNKSASKVVSKTKVASTSDKQTQAEKVLLTRSQANGNGKDKVKENDNVFLGRASREKNKKRYGEFANVLLSDLDVNNLKYQFHSDYDKRIEKLSAYKKSHPGFKSPDDYATIKLWAMRAEEEQQNAQPVDKDDDTDTKQREQMLDDAWDDAVAAIWADVDAENKQEDANAEEA